MSRDLSWEPTDADLTAYLLDDLEGARAEYVAAHLERCRNCQERLAVLRAGLERLSSLPDPGGDEPQERSALIARIQLEAAGNAP